MYLLLLLLLLQPAVSLRLHGLKSFLPSFLQTGGSVQRHHRDKTLCEELDWRKASLKLLREVPFAALFRDLKGETKFEASGLAHVNNSYFVVFDR